MKIRSVVLMLAVGALALATQAAALPPAGPCTMPATASATPAETAWRLFVAANCPGSGTQLVWETWTEQAQVYPASGKAGSLGATVGRRLHGSPLAHATMARKTGLTAELTPSTECNKMGGPPANVVPGATICEEARLNPAAKLFVVSKGYQVRPGQTLAARAQRVPALASALEFWR